MSDGPARTEAPPPPPPAPPAPTAPPAPPARPRHLWLLVADGVMVVAVAVAIVLVRGGGDGPTTTVAISTTTTAVVTSTSTTSTSTTVAASTTTTAPTTTTTSTTTTLPPADRYGPLELDYFREIAGRAEFGDTGDRLQKWTSDVRIVVYGSPTEQDREALASVVGDLNKIIGPIEVVIVDSYPDLEVHFAPQSEFAAIEPNYVAGQVGFVYIWRDAGGSLTSGRALISTTGTTAQERAHLIREEVTQGLGLLNDSWAYPDSIFYQGWTTAGYAPIDRLVIEMLYRPEVPAGMTVDDAVAVLAGLTGG